MDSNSAIHLFCFVSKGGNIMNTNYKFTTRQQERPNTMPQPYPPCMPQNCVPYPPYQPAYEWPFNVPQLFSRNPFMPPQPPMYQPTYGWHPDTIQQLFSRNPFMHPQQPMAINKRFITNENEEFIIDPADTKLNAFSTELTDKHICSIDFNDIKIEISTSRYRIYGPLTATAYINKDGSIDFVLWDPYNDELEESYERGEEEPIDFCDPELYKRTFTTEEIKSIGDHCMEKLLVAFMNEALKQEQKNK